MKNNFDVYNKNKIKCKYCDKISTKYNIEKHEPCCYLNPKNIKLCKVCNKPIKNYKTNETCGYACSNKLFRSGENNGNWKEEAYRSTCFLHHDKKCVCCDEKLIIAVHHYDENKNNNNPENLIPLCPTHHSYWHSKYRYIIVDKVEDYRNKFLDVVQSGSTYALGA